MDAGRLEDLPRGVLGKRLPDWLRPPQVPPADWAKMRPDLAILPDRDTPDKPTDKKIWLLELGYCSDTNQATKFNEKQDQHASLVNHLKELGCIVHYEIITLGTTGTIPKSVIPTLRTLGVDYVKAVKLADKLHAHTIMCFKSILQSRRVLGSTPAGIG